MALPVAALRSVPWLSLASSMAICVVTVIWTFFQPRPNRGIGSHWQVPRGRRLRRFGRHGTFVVWGALLGTGFLTVVPSAIALLLPAGALASLSSGSVLLSGVTFGVSRAPVVVGAAASSPGRSGDVIDMLGTLRARYDRLSQATVIPLAGCVTAVCVASLHSL